MHGIDCFSFRPFLFAKPGTILGIAQPSQLGTSFYRNLFSHSALDNS